MLKSRLFGPLLGLFAASGAVMMFVLEPLIGRLMVPKFGGGFYVWTTCLMFFQATLLLGYVYAHIVLPRIGRWHLLLVFAGLVALPIGVTTEPDPSASIGRLLVVLSAEVALPFGILSTTAIVAQQWLARSDSAGAANPYYLYAASNFGSLLGLLIYPLLIEPLFGIDAQRWLWSAAYIAYAALALVIAFGFIRNNEKEWKKDIVDSSSHPSPATVLYWLGLSAAPSILLMAVTNALSLGAGSFPLVWILPLSIYLLTFIFAFSGKKLFSERILMFWPEVFLLSLLVFGLRMLIGEITSLSLLLAALFFTGYKAHFALYRSRPAPRYLTTFYLTIATGGWLGGAFVSLVVPKIFTGLSEFVVGIVLLAFILVRGKWTAMYLWFVERDYNPLRVFRLAIVGVLLGSIPLWFYIPTLATYSFRNYYGLHEVMDLTKIISSSAKSLNFRVLYHNGTLHGVQYRSNALEQIPVGYHYSGSPYERLFERLPQSSKLGVVGLGVGAMAAYFDSQDELTFYEIDPDVERIARTYFSYLSHSAANLKVVLGDGRQRLSEIGGPPDGHFDALIVDAFSGDAVPYHLLTQEAMALYLKKINREGFVMFNISSRFYELWPIIAATAGGLGATAMRIVVSTDEKNPLNFPSEGVVITRNEELELVLREQGWTTDVNYRARPWTDDYVNILIPLRLRMFPTENSTGHVAQTKEPQKPVAISHN